MDLNARTQKMAALNMFSNGVVNAGVEDPNAQAVSWSPGDGYRYNVLFNILPKSINYLIGGSEDHILVSYHDGMKIRTWPMIDGSLQTVQYVAETFGLNAEDNRTKYLTALINMTIGVFDYGHGVYDKLKEMR